MIETHFPLESPIINKSSFFKSSFNSLAEVFTLRTTENNGVSSAKSFALLAKLPFIQIMNNNGPRIDPWRTQA